jgi:DNA-binding transcriptional LysR family regulator
MCDCRELTLRARRELPTGRCVGRPAAFARYSPSMDARQLKYFLAVHEHGGVMRAAEALFIAQPSISQAIRSLESELGVALFNRVGRGLKISPAGEALIGPARQVQRGLVMAREAVDRISSVQSGHLDVAVTSDLAVDPLADFVAAFRSAYAGVSVHVFDAQAGGAAADMVREGMCELALCAVPTNAKNLKTLRLGRRELLYCTPPGHGAGAQEIRLRDLGRAPLIAGPRDDVIRDLIDATFASIEAEPAVRVETSVASAIPDMVLAGVGSAFLPPGIAAGAAARGAELHRTDPPLRQDFGFLYRGDDTIEASRRFMSVAQKVMADLRHQFND